MSDTPTPRTDALSAFLVQQFPATLGNLELHKKLTEFERLERDRNAWKQCAEELAADLLKWDAAYSIPSASIASFNKLKEQTK